ncbi:WUSCHEL-related homeobox 11-like, partial [Magnolia sinica]|uniref:WUSCHEL-related homeobox 11-like n=1 Tax=Magnolia sinica TaxID=86752 RepID=UPI0026580C2E
HAISFLLSSLSAHYFTLFDFVFTVVCFQQSLLNYMDDRANDSTNGPINGSERSEPVRSRWTPKPEQILILESIFNSGMVNPPKDETVRIRKLLEKFGSVGDANVFYWFQNRRSRSRRRQRQIQAGLANDSRIPVMGRAGSAIQYESTSASSGSGCLVSSSSVPFPASSSCILASPSYHCGGFVEDGSNDLFSISQQMGLAEIEHTSSGSSMFWPSDNSNLHYQSGFITVFINGVPSEVPRAPLDVRAMFGQDVMLVHSSGEPVPVNEYGISLQSLQLGENYFLVSRPT